MVDGARRTGLFLTKWGFFLKREALDLPLFFQFVDAEKKLHVSFLLIIVATDIPAFQRTAFPFQNYMYA